jgi:hypothetical protein
MATDGSPDDTPPNAMRLIFEYEGDTVRLVNQYPVKAVIADYEPTGPKRAGFYIDSRDAAGTPLARVPARDAFGKSLEVFPEQPGDPLMRMDAPDHRGAFSVIVPLPEGTDRVTVVRVGPAESTAAMSGPHSIRPMVDGSVTADIATFPLNISR